MIKNTSGPALRAVTYAVSFSLFLGQALPARAAWHSQADQLQGSGKSAIITSVAIGGGVVAGALLYKKFKNRGPASNVKLPDNLGFATPESKMLVVRNEGQTPINISELSIRGDGYEFASRPRLPLIVPGKGLVEVPVRLTHAGKKARVEVTWLEHGRERAGTVSLCSDQATPAVTVATAR